MIRHARESDYEKIITIREPYLLDTDRINDYGYRWRMQQSGFIGNLSEVEFQKDLHHLFLVSEDESGMLGYLRIDRDHEYQDNDKKIWLRDVFKKEYFTGHHAEIGMIGVRSDMKGRGIGSDLLTEAITQLQGKDIAWLFSIVVFSPITNFPSMMFHEKHEFIRVAISRPHHHFDMEDYQSILYKKPL